MLVITRQLSTFLKSNVSWKKKKAIEVDCHFIREKITKEIIWCHSSSQKSQLIVIQQTLSNSQMFDFLDNLTSAWLTIYSSLKGSVGWVNILGEVLWGDVLGLDYCRCGYYQFLSVITVISFFIWLIFPFVYVVPLHFFMGIFVQINFANLILGLVGILPKSPTP